MHGVIIDEDRLREEYTQLHSYADKMEERYRTYLDVLRRMRLSVILSGETADALTSFTEHAQKLQLQFDNLANDFEELSASFTREVDNVDDF